MSNRPLFMPATVDDIPRVAVGVELNEFLSPVDAGSPSIRAPHAALLYRDDPDNGGHVRVLEMHLNGKVVSGGAERAADFAWAVPNISQDQADVVAGFCETIVLRNPRLKYGFSFLKGTTLIEQGTSIDIGGGTVGLTCATFVLAIFQSRGIHLAQLDTWKESQHDREWQTKWMKFISDDPRRGGYGLSPEALSRAKAELDTPCLRYTPQDVVGVCQSGSHPTDCDTAGPLGTRIWNWLNALHDIRKNK